MVSDSLLLDSLLLRSPIPEEAAAHLDHLTTAFSTTPDGVGIIQAGMAEAFVAREYAWLAGRDTSDVRAMSSAMGHVLHAIDPSAAGSGAGLGYGFRRAAEAVVQHMSMALEVEGIPEHLAFHGPYVIRAAEGAIERSYAVEGLARRIRSGSDAAATHALVEQIRPMVRAMAYGTDVDGDGRIGHTEDEVGLAQAWYHLNLLYRIEAVYIPEMIPDALDSRLPDFAALRAVEDSIGPGRRR
ncbi:MAG: hypothetical protein AAF389_06935 [Gemmatimonadota bacterium]